MSGYYFVSAVISLFKGEKFIRGRLDDLLAQSLGKQAEIIIIDSNSPQNEKAIIEEYLTKNDNIKYLRTDFTESMYAAWNRGIAMANGKYITNANVDDRLAPNALEELANALENDPSAGLVYGDYFVSPKENENFETAKQKGRPVRVSGEFSPLHLLHGYMCGPQSLWRKTLHDENNIWFDESFEVTGDYKFVADITKVTKLKYLPKNLGVYYRSQADENKEFQNLEKTTAEAFRIKYELINFYLDHNTLSVDRPENRKALRNIKFYPSLSVRAASILWKLDKRAVINYETVFFIAAVQAEKEGNLAKTMKIIKKFENYPAAVYIHNYEKYLREKGAI
ncbi:MAG: glycosyltransferase [Ignavibacteriales bacterium]|nr:MAG: glycosyltransferase [Ignavibacteriaceae bacterium]MBW7873898.1 glycosyltransferase family 2 protein [Ignavibacteria bacterium]MCZ2143343.1 glycosyltransferase [Ignavibacteriales bacterium]OQY77608.1 MAG: hypothetical protein B6D45_02600 [Ignavibacteriales bacterium UTCHB3]MBV6444224.1 hypothetical protein [Ignavibacteriaceae bacterium]